MKIKIKNTSKGNQPKSKKVKGLKQKKAVKEITDDSPFTEDELELFEKKPGRKFSIDISPRIKRHMEQYIVSMVSFKNTQHTSAYSILNPDDPQEWHVLMLEEFVQKLKEKLNG